MTAIACGSPPVASATCSAMPSRLTGSRGRATTAAPGSVPRPTAGTARWSPTPRSSTAQGSAICSTTATATVARGSAMRCSASRRGRRARARYRPNQATTSVAVQRYRPRTPMTESAHEIPFNRACTTGRELESIAEAIGCAHLAADGPFTANCRAWLEEHLGCPMALLVHSCTAALEVSALLLDVVPGDEVIMPSFTFVTTATAFALRGATPVFIDVRPDTLNLDERLLEDAITARTKAIVPVHYAGVGCAMKPIAEIASARSIAIVEDAAQGICAEYAGRPLGTLGALGAISFHETKNVTSGHGGVLLVNDQRLLERAEILRDKGTNRSMFF